MRRLVAGLATSVLMISATPSARAAGPHDCGQGEVQSVLQALPIGIFAVNDLFDSIKPAGLGGGVGDGGITEGCQYRLFFDGATVTFGAGEPFLGGITYFVGYKDLDISRQDGTEIIDEFVDRVWLNEVGGVPVEQQLAATSFKNFHHPAAGLSVYQHRGFMTQLDVGTYESRWELSTPDGTILETATMTIQIVE